MLAVIDTVICADWCEPGPRSNRATEERPDENDPEAHPGVGGDKQTKIANVVELTSSRAYLPQRIGSHPVDEYAGVESPGASFLRSWRGLPLTLVSGLFNEATVF